jgi:hypothetical protein
LLLKVSLFCIPSPLQTCNQLQIPNHEKTPFENAAQPETRNRKKDRYIEAEFYSL